MRLFRLVTLRNRVHELPFDGWYGELEYGARWFNRIRPQPAAMRVDDGPADRQAHPHSAAFRRVEGLEHALETFRVNART